MNQLARFGIVLGTICLAATLVLAFTYEMTKPKIEEAMRAEEREALRTIMPEADSFDPKSLDGFEYFDAVKSSSVIGYCLKVTGSGYGGYMRMIVGVDKSGIIKGVRVLEHQETPGLGSKVTEVHPGESEPYFLRQFKGRRAGGLVVKRDIDIITGATISSKAVTDAINDSVSSFLTKMKGNG